MVAPARHLADTADGAGPAPDGPTTAQQNTRLRAGRTRLRQRRLRQQ
ncbi:hypothetical protein [Streptomyces chiangmaiensis]|uniref:Uncharacterized protein n=1 Tax=Streptomyces chiangmaiensis TaxID=766497 RepID=A0ABU7FQF5_9ACTN|nr:hypothetical protein [Streptomyces chiangmaiensis]MED7826355.1 hypothetical protein [Streptomyces chiangmaiensis]